MRYASDARCDARRSTMSTDEYYGIPASTPMALLLIAAMFTAIFAGIAILVGVYILMIDLLP